MAYTTLKPFLTPPQTRPRPFGNWHRCNPPSPLIPPQLSRWGVKITINSLIPGVDGGGVSDDFVSTRKTQFGSGFDVIANMVKRIAPLDISIISKGVSESAKDSMKQTISSMLGLLPSDQFDVTVRVCKLPLDRLIVSSIITGYTLWNAEYRISLMRNFDLSMESYERITSLNENGVSELKGQDTNGGGENEGFDKSVEDFDKTSAQNLGDLSPEVLSYIRELESKLSSVNQELHVGKQQNLRTEFIRKNNNDLLKYLRSLESDMVVELSRPSSSEVEEVIHQLAQSTLQLFFKVENPSKHQEGSTLGFRKSFENVDDVSCDFVGTSRDYLAKLLFWCMLLGHHLRGLENRLHLSCVVGLL